MDQDFDLENGNRIIASMDPAELKAAMGNWSKFIRLPWDAQRAIQAAHPAAVQKLRDNYFALDGPGR